MIPPTVHLIWIQGRDQAPVDYLQNVERFSELHPDWNVRWWDDAQIRAADLPGAELYAQADKVVPPDSAHQFRSDIARYGILHEYGGMYVDLDYRWQKPLAPLLGDHELVTSWELQFRFVANGMIAATPKHPAFPDILGIIPRRIREAKRGMRANWISGPRVWTDVAKRHRAHILHQRTLHPVPWHSPELADSHHPESVAVHVWGHQRQIRGMR